MVEINISNEKLYQEKADIIEWVKNLTDYEIISQIKFIKEQPLTDWADELDINEQNAILEGLDDIENQRFVPNSKVQELYEKWI